MKLLEFGLPQQVTGVLWPTNDDTAVKAYIVSEGADAQTGSTDKTFANVQFDAYNYASGFIRVSKQLLVDSAFNFQMLLEDNMTLRMFRGVGEHLTTGTGTNQPRGVVTATTQNQAAAAAAAISRQDLVNLQHTVDRAYRISQRPNVGFMLNDDTLKAIKLLAIGSGDDRPLWQPSMRDGEPSTIEGFRYFVNPYIADIGTTNISALFGDFSRYIARNITGYRAFNVSAERFMEFDQTAFVMFDGWDGDLVDNKAIGKLTHP